MKIKPFTEKDLFKLLKSRKFTDKLNQASDINYQTGGESGFSVAITNKRKLIYGDVVTPSKNELSFIQGSVIHYALDTMKDSLNIILDEKDLYEDSDFQYNDVLNFHFHPFNYSFFPSKEDITSNASEKEFNYKKGLNINPYSLIATQKPNKSIETLVLQETSKKPLGKEAEFVYEDICNNKDLRQDDPETILKAFNETGKFHAFLINYKRKSNKYKLDLQRNI